MDIETLQRELDTRDKGVIAKGSHTPESREFCAIEFGRAVKGLPWGDTPDAFPDFRRINDGFRSEAARTHNMLLMLLAFWDWRDWPRERRTAWATRVAIQTVRHIVAELPTLDKARAAAKAAASASASASAAAAASAADAAAAAAAYAADAAADRILETACAIWIEAANGE